MNSPRRVLGLPGRDAATEAWLTALLNSLDIGACDIRVQRYRFWADPSLPLDPAVEAEIAAQLPPDLLVAKSFGTIVAVTAHVDHALRPRASVFIGTPLVAYTDDRLRALRSYCAAARVLFIQQTNDMTGSHADLAAIVATQPGCVVVEVPGGDHVYSDIGDQSAVISAWCNR